MSSSHGFSYIALELFGASLYVGWTIVTVYISLLGMTFFLRFMNGAWKTMQVIEKIPPAMPLTLPEAPTSELEP